MHAFRRSRVRLHTAFTSPNRGDRQRARAALRAGHFFEVYVRADMGACKARDAKGRYRSARQGELKGFTSIDSPYEEPAVPDLVIDTTRSDEAACVAQLMRFVAGNCRA